MVQTPTTYPPSQDIPIPVFEFTDIAAGTGVVEYFGAVSKDPTAEYILTEKQVYTAQRETSRTGAGTTTLNFDLTPFNLPRTAKGTAVISIPVFNLNSGVSTIIKVTIQKVSGATTSISSEITSESVSGANIAEMILLNIPLTQTHFKKGDILRAVVKITTQAASTGAIGHSPNNIVGEVNILEPIITSNNIVMIMKLNIPYRIDV